MKVRAYSHLLGECGVSVFGTERIAARYRRGFPRSLDGAPFLLPSEDSALRLSLEEWFQKQGSGRAWWARSRTALSSTRSGRRARGCSPCPRPSRRRCGDSTGSGSWASSSSVRQRFYAITVERKLRNPAVIAISERARALFA